MDLTKDESTLLSKFYSKSLNKVTTFKRLLRDGECFYSSIYSRVKCRNSFTISYTTENTEQEYGLIEFFVLSGNKPGVVLRKLRTLPVPEIFKPDQGLTPVEKTALLQVVPPTSVQEKCMLITVNDNNSYVVKFPTKLRID